MKHESRREYPVTISVLLLVAVLAGAALVSAAQLKPVGFVSDFANVLSPDQRARLENLCREAKQKAKVEIAVVTLDEIPEGQAISAFTVELGQEWGVGTKGDRGAMLLYKTGKQDGKRQVYLATGYGLEGEIPDAKAGRILDNVTIPLMREGKYYEAFAATVSTVVGIVAPEVRLTGAPPPQSIPGKSDRGGSNLPGLFFMLLIFLALFGPRGLRGFIFGMLIGSSFGGRGGGWGGGGGGFGGGFGGFGGGGFGGGGAGRSF